MAKRVIKDSGKRRKFITGAVRDSQENKGRMDLLPVRAIIELAKHFEAGSKKYGSRNWEKGMGLSIYLDSGIRHALRYLRGDSDEPHLEAACWNIMCLLDTQERIKEGLLPEELNDLPNNPLEIRDNPFGIQPTKKPIKRKKK